MMVCFDPANAVCISTYRDECNRIRENEDTIKQPVQVNTHTYTIPANGCFTGESGLFG